MNLTYTPYDNEQGGTLRETCSQCGKIANLECSDPFHHFDYFVFHTPDSLDPSKVYTMDMLERYWQLKDISNNWVDCLIKTEPIPDKRIEFRPCLRLKAQEEEKEKTLMSDVEIAEVAKIKSYYESCDRTEDAFLLHLIDVVWGEAHEDESVPSTPWAKQMIAKARETFNTTNHEN